MDGLETQIMKNGRKLFLHYCGFKIREDRYNQIVSSKIVG